MTPVSPSVAYARMSGYQPPVSIPNCHQQCKNMYVYWVCTGPVMCTYTYFTSVPIVLFSKWVLVLIYFLPMNQTSNVLYSSSSDSESQTTAVWTLTYTLKYTCTCCPKSQSILILQCAERVHDWTLVRSPRGNSHKSTHNL